MSIDSPPSHRISRFLTGILITLSVAVIVGLLYAEYGVLLVDAGKQLAAEVRSAWEN